MKVIVRPVTDPECEIDITQRLVAAIAEELWRLYGGNDELNWIEAECHLERIVGAARAEAKGTVVVQRRGVDRPGAAPARESAGEPAACAECPRRRPREARRSERGVSIQRSAVWTTAPIGVGVGR
jgi:hypothetical protein